MDEAGMRRKIAHSTKGVLSAQESLEPSCKPDKFAAALWTPTAA
jgi:hypothetical protein